MESIRAIMTDRMDDLETRWKDTTIKYNLDSEVVSEIVMKEIDSRFLEVDTTSSLLIDRITKLESAKSKNIDHNELLTTRLSELQGRIKNLESNPHPPRKDNSQTNEEVKKKTVEYSNLELDADTVFICDSNGKKIDTDRLHRTEKVTRVICYTFEHILQMLTEVKVVKQPKKILLLVGTNEVDNFKDEQSLTLAFSKVLENLRQKFAIATISVSLIHPMKDKGTINTRI